MELTITVKSEVNRIRTNLCAALSYIVHAKDELLILLGVLSSSRLSVMCTIITTAVFVVKNVSCIIVVCPKVALIYMQT